MIQKGAAILAIFAAVALISSAVGQTNPSAGTPSSSPAQVRTAAPRPSSPVPTASPAASTASGSSDCPGGNCELPQPHITIATPAPAPAPWPWQQRISWGADLILVIMAYIGIMMALSILRRIERQGRYIEEAVQSASTSAAIALKQVESLQRTERPWILMNVRSAIGVENGFSIFAVNRGRTPAQIISTVDDAVCVTDENALDPLPVFKKTPSAPEEPIILLPEETIELVSFSRADVKQVCGSSERMQRVEDWQEKIYLYGKIVYRSLTAPDDAPAHESSWCSWYIHGRQKSGMVMAGPPAYNRHT